MKIAMKRKYPLVFVLSLFSVTAAWPAPKSAPQPTMDQQIAHVDCLYKDLKIAAKSGKLKKKARGFEDCRGDYSYKAVFTNAAKVIRIYIRAGGSDDSACAEWYFYDGKGRLRLAIIQAGAVNGASEEVRLYVDALGGIFKTEKDQKGPGYAGLATNSPELELTPAEDFNEKSPCLELKNPKEFDDPGLDKLPKELHGKKAGK
jgi:hypothetical protein